MHWIKFFRKEFLGGSIILCFLDGLLIVEGDGSQVLPLKYKNQSQANN